MMKRMQQGGGVPQQMTGMNMGMPAMNIGMNTGVYAAGSVKSINLLVFTRRILPSLDGIVIELIFHEPSLGVGQLIHCLVQNLRETH